MARKLDPKAIGERLRRARLAKSLTQEEVAERIGLVSAQGYQAYEYGQVIPPHRRLERLSEVLGVSEQAILYGRGEEKGTRRRQAEPSVFDENLRRLTRLWRKVPPDKQPHVLRLIHQLLKLMGVE